MCRVIVLWGAFGVTFFVLLALVLKDIKVSNFLPFLEHGIGPVVAGAMAPGSLFIETAIILMVIPFMSDRNRAVRNSLAAVFMLL